MPENADLLERIAAIFRRSLHRDVPSIDTDLFESGVLDSLAFVELLLQLERECGVRATVEDIEVDNFRTVAQIARFVGERARVAPRIVAFPAGA